LKKDSRFQIILLLQNISSELKVKEAVLSEVKLTELDSIKLIDRIL